MSIRELHNNIVSSKKDGGLKEARDEDDNIIINDSTLRSLLPPQFLKIMVENVAYMPKVCIRHYYHGVIVI